MLVSGLKNASLSIMISGDNVDCLRVHESLCQCVRDMLARYEQKQECSIRRQVKSLALKTLLSALGSAPANSRTTISSALKCHAVMLQGYEHLLSARGNTCELMKQTQVLREADNNACASLLRYHDLKNKLLGSDTLLSAEQKEVISALAEKKSLALKTLETLEAYPGTTAKELMKLNEIILGTPELCAGAFNHKDSITIAKLLAEVHEAGMSKPDLFAILAEYKSEINDFSITCDEAVIALGRLKGNKLDTPDYCSAVLKHKKPLDVSKAIIHLHSCHFLLDENLNLVITQEDPFAAAKTLVILNKAGLFKLDPNLFARVLEHEYLPIAVLALKTLNEAGLLKETGLCVRVLQHSDPDEFAYALVMLHRYKLDTTNNCSMVFKERYPYHAATVIIDLYLCDMLTTDKYLEQVFRNGHVTLISRIFIMLCENLLTQDNLYTVINHPDIVRLHEEIDLEFVNNPGRIEQDKFEACLARVGSVAES